MARTTCSLGNPISMISRITDSSCAPVANTLAGPGPPRRVRPPPPRPLASTLWDNICSFPPGEGPFYLVCTPNKHLTLTLNLRLLLPWIATTARIPGRSMQGQKTA